MSSPPACQTCQKTAPQAKLKHCAKCSTTLYCSRECQKTDWKTHKKTCGKGDDGASGSGSGSSTAGGRAGTTMSPPKGLEQPIVSPFTRLDRGTWLHDRPEKDVYQLLIDAYRLQVEDEYTMGGEVNDDSLYGGASDGLRGFRRFVARATKRGQLLPPWWSAAKMAECERFGMGGSDWADLRCAVEKSDIIEHYGDARFPMQLRMFAEAVNLRGPGGADGTAMRKMMVAMENAEIGEEMQGVTIDATTGNETPL